MLHVVYVILTKNTTHEKKVLAIIFYISHSRPYLYRGKFNLWTNYKTLVRFENPGTLVHESHVGH